jgi:Holliday junction resolvase
MVIAKSKKTNASITRKIREIVRQLERQGWEVRADMRGRTAPAPINDKAPDIEALKNGRRLLIEVETYDSLRVNEEYVRGLIRHAASRGDTRFDLVIVVPRKKAGSPDGKDSDAEHAH